MKIDSITLQNFRCFEHLDFKFDKPINFIFGSNASGKSTIAESLALALTGRCNGVNYAKGLAHKPNWRDRAALGRHGADQFKVELELNGEKVIHRPELKDCSPKPDAIAKKLNVSKEALATLFDTRHFFCLHADEKKRIIFDLLDLSACGDGQAGHIDPDADLLSVLGSVPGSLEAAYKEAFDERIREKTEYDTYICQDEEIKPDDSRVQNLNELGAALSRFDRIEDFLFYVDQLRASQKDIKKDHNQARPVEFPNGNLFNGVNLMTLHKSKGLEFKAVFLFLSPRIHLAGLLRKRIIWPWQAGGMELSVWHGSE